MAIADTDYSATLAITDYVNALQDAALAVNNIGMSQVALVTGLSETITNFNLLTAKLDSDTGAEDADYAATYDIDTLATTGEGITTHGMYQTDLYTSLSSLETNFNAVLTKLDSDTGVADTDYNSTYAIDLDDNASGNGLNQEIIVSFLDSAVTNFNSTLTKLDADAD